MASQCEREPTSSTVRLVNPGSQIRAALAQMAQFKCGLELHDISVYLSQEKVQKVPQDKKLVVRSFAYSLLTLTQP